MLCDSMWELGLDKEVEKVVEVIFDVCVCFNYVVLMIEQVVDCVFNVVDWVQLLQMEIEIRVESFDK